MNRFIKLLISIIALLFLVFFVNISEVINVFPNFNLVFLPVIIFMVLVNILLYVVTYWTLLQKKFSLSETILDYLVVWSFGLFLPGKMGELGIIPVLKKKQGVPYKLAAPAVIAPKVVIVVLLLGLALFFGFDFVSGTWFLIWAISLLVLIILIFVIFRKKLKSLFFKFSFLSDIYKNREEIVSIVSPTNIITLFIIAIFRIFFIIGLFYVLYLSFGFIIGIELIVLAVVLSQLAAFVPISLNGLGIREATFVGIMTSFGISASLSAGVILAPLIISYLIAIVTILIWNLKK